MTDNASVVVEGQPRTANLPAGSPGSTAPPMKIVIQPSQGWFALKLVDLWEYRELLYFLVWRDVKVRYKQTVLGAAPKRCSFRSSTGAYRKGHPCTHRFG